MRTDERQKHVGLRLRLRVGAVWEQIEALDWNRIGFNFHCAHALSGPTLQFKRGRVAHGSKIAGVQVLHDAPSVAVPPLH